MKTRSSKPARGGFTLLEVMVAVAILAVTVIPMLLLREESYSKAVETKAVRVAQRLAQEKLSYIALEVRTGEGAGEFEEWPAFQFEYNVTLYDFGAGMEEGLGDLNDPFNDPYGNNYNNNYNDPLGDQVFIDDDEKTFGPMVMRHVELKVLYPEQVGEGETQTAEYVIDTYIPLLLTEEQYETKIHDDQGEQEP